MSWNNYGNKDDCWVIDHRIPLSFFNLDDPTEQKQACHYTNLQPMWRNENIQKGKNLVNKFASFLEPKYV